MIRGRAIAVQFGGWSKGVFLRSLIIVEQMATRQSKPCLDFKLLGSCKNGDKCYRSHDVEPIGEDQRFIGYVSLPARVSIAIALGKHANNLEPVRRVAECVVKTSERNPREVTIATASSKDLEAVKRKLEAMFAQLYPIGPTWCYLHAEGITGPFLKFLEYHGRLPTKFYGEKRKSSMYEVCCHSEVYTSATTISDTLVKELEKLNPMQLDSMDNLYSVLETLCDTSASTTGKRASADDLAKELLTPPNKRVRILQNYQGHIREQLQGALSWFLENCDQASGPTSESHQLFKLEARFGKVLWGDLPEDVLAYQESWSVQDFAGFLFSNPKYIRTFNTDIKPEDAERLRQDLAGMTDCKQWPTLETFDLKLSASGEKLDVRLKVCSGGKLEVVVIRMGERKLLTFDILCMHRQHDVRMSFSQLQVVFPSHRLFGVTQKMLREVSFSEPGTLRLNPCTEEWNINFIRHKKRTPYVLEGKYITTVSCVGEYTVGMKHPKERPITIKPDNYSNHTEVEFHSIVWECAFGKDIDPDPAKSLALYMDQPTIDSDVATSIPHPWDAAAIVHDLDDILGNLETLNEFLGRVR